MTIDVERRALRALPPRLVYQSNRLRGNGATPWVDVVESLQQWSVTAVGFDVFDTLLTRDLNDQEVLLDVLAQRLSSSDAWDGSPAEYRAARASASKRVPGENLISWYQQPEMSAKANIEACLRAEFELEESITSAVPGAVEVLEQLRAADIEISFISDMHLPTNFIIHILEREEIRRDLETVLVSGDAGCWKGSGKLFEQWLITEGLNPATTAYVGNHKFVDDAVPRSIGIRVKARRAGNPVRYEELLAKGGVAGAAIAAASTKARLLDDDRRPTVATLGASVAGQSMMAFLLALRATCREDDIRQLVFVARDGELPYRMAESMPKDYWSSIDAHYIHANRITLALAGAHHLGIELWLQLGTADRHSFLRIDAAATPVSALLGRIDLGVEELPEHLVDLLGTEPGREAGERNLGSGTIDDATWLRLLNDPQVGALIAERAEERFNLATDYIRGLGLRDEPTMIVDVGWRGQTAIVLSGVFHEVLGIEPRHFHFGGYGVRPEIDELVAIERYAFDDSTGPAPFRGVDQCVEIFTGAGQPRALGYQRLNGAITPILDSGNSLLATGVRAELWQMAMNLAESMPPAERLDQWTDRPPEPEAVIELLKAFWLNPTADEGMLATRLTIETDDRGESIMPVSNPYRLRDLWSPAPRRWAQGSLAASGPAMRFILSLLRRGR